MNATKIYRLFLPLLCLFSFTACTDLLIEADPQDSPVENFELLWKEVNDKYTLFEYKNIDWQAVYQKYRPQVSDKTTDEDLFNILNAMLNELKDGHVSLIAPFNAASNRSWYFNYPPNYNANIIERNYLKESRRIILPFRTQWVDSSVAYIRYSSFGDAVSSESMQQLYNYYGKAKGWIIDIRDNTGGSLGNVDAIMSRFIDTKTKVGAVQYKIGPDRKDLSKIFPYFVEPKEKGGKYFGKIIVLTNRKVYSAANFFTSTMSVLNNVTILGDQTGGGGGAPYSGQLLNGWSYTFSTTLLLSIDNQFIENGVVPDIKLDLSPADEAKGVDTILERAIALLK